MRAFGAAKEINTLIDRMLTFMEETHSVYNVRGQFSHKDAS